MPAPSRRSLTAAQQFLNLRISPIASGAGSLRAGRLVWRFAATPSPLSRQYTARIEYAHGHSPKLFIEAPDLNDLAAGRRLPHVYEQRPPRLCLYLPGTEEWHPALRLDQTIVPWTSLWLYYFEDWLVTDQWSGGGMHPDDPTAPRQLRRFLLRGLRTPTPATPPMSGTS
jgi:hypothetical protein